jgi:hypothetical protein
LYEGITADSQGSDKFDSNEKRRIDHQVRERNQEMSSFQISDFTLAGACVGAVKAAEVSDRLNAARDTRSSKGPRHPGFLVILVRRVMNAIVEKRSSFFRPIRRQA